MQDVLSLVLGTRARDDNPLSSFCFTADGDPLHVGLEDREFFFYTSDVSLTKWMEKAVMST